MTPTPLRRVPVLISTSCIRTGWCCPRPYAFNGRCWRGVRRRCPIRRRYADRPQPQQGRLPAKLLVHGDGSRKALETWVDLLAGVAEWLISNKRLTAQRCPVRLGSKNYPHTEPAHPNSMSFRTDWKIGGLYVFTDVCPSDVIRHAKSPIEKAGLNPSDSKADWRGSPRRD